MEFKLQNNQAESDQGGLHRDSVRLMSPEVGPVSILRNALLALQLLPSNASAGMCLFVNLLCQRGFCVISWNKGKFVLIDNVIMLFGKMIIISRNFRLLKKKGRDLWNPLLYHNHHCSMSLLTVVQQQQKLCGSYTSYYYNIQCSTIKLF